MRRYGFAAVATLFSMTAQAAEIVGAGPGRPPILGLAGEIVPGDAARLEAAIAQADAGRVFLMLNSPGGDDAESIKLMELVRRHHAETFVGAWGTCAGGCLLVFAAGSTKTVDAGARIGGHIEMKISAWLSKLGVPHAVIGALVHTPGSEPYWLTQTDLASMRVRVEPPPRAR